VLENIVRGCSLSYTDCFISAFVTVSRCDYVLEKTIHPPLVRHLYPTSGIGATVSHLWSSPTREDG
jgi:hypothetical protein